MEVLACLAIALILYAVLLPLLARAKREGWHTDDLAKLRQLGQAAALYSSDEEHRITSCAELVDANAVDLRLCQSPIDNTQLGLANVALMQSDRVSKDDWVHPRKYRISFVGARDVLVDRRIELGVPGTKGWLVDLGKSEREVPNTDNPSLLGMRTGTYRRLLDDTAVVTRHFIRREMMHKGQKHQCFGNHWAYVDYSQEFLEVDCKKVLDAMFP